MLYPMIQILVTLDYIKYPEALSMQALHPQEARLLALVSREGGADEDKSIGHQNSGWTKMKWSSSCEFMILILYNIVWLYIYIYHISISSHFPFVSHNLVYFRVFLPFLPPPVADDVISRSTVFCDQLGVGLRGTTVKWTKKHWNFEGSNNFRDVEL